MRAKPLNLIPLHVTLLAMSATALIAVIAKSSGLVVNVTGSMPGIVYQLGHGERGSLVSFCSPIAHPSIGYGACPDGRLPLIKRVVGVAGDRVTASDAGVEVNGQPVPNSRQLDFDSKGHALPHLRGSFRVKQGEIWVAGEHPNSFDSRYFGPVKLPKDDLHNKTRISPVSCVRCQGVIGLPSARFMPGNWRPSSAAALARATRSSGVITI
jgi:conjugative transfer signal peptidase TraF